jgi:hypothetical protein
MKGIRVGLLIIGIVAAFFGVVFLATGGALVWAQTTQRDADGYYSTSAEHLTSPTSALTSGALDLGSHPGDWLPSDLATVRIQAQPAGLFIGIGPTAEVRHYLRGVGYTQVTDVRFDPFRVSYRQVEGSGTPEPPGQQEFWAVSSTNGELTWDVRSGAWSIVVMNADGSRGVDADLSVGVKTGLLLPAGIVLLVLGVLFSAGAIALILASRRRKGADTLPPGATPARPDAPGSTATPPPPP